MNTDNARLDAGEHIFGLPDGRTLHLFVHTCPDCTSVDVWTTRGKDDEAVSTRTGDTTRAPMGLMPWLNGLRPVLDAQPTEGSYGWPAVSTATLVWDGGVDQATGNESEMTVVFGADDDVDMSRAEAAQARGWES